MLTEWNEKQDPIVVHCIGCGRESPCQHMPTPFCPNCAHDPKFKAYWRAVFASAIAGEREACATVADEASEFCDSQIAKAKQDGRSGNDWIARRAGCAGVADEIRARGTR